MQLESAPPFSDSPSLGPSALGSSRPLLSTLDCNSWTHSRFLCVFKFVFVCLCVCVSVCVFVLVFVFVFVSLCVCVLLLFDSIPWFGGPVVGVALPKRAVCRRIAWWHRRRVLLLVKEKRPRVRPSTPWHLQPSNGSTRCAKDEDEPATFESGWNLHENRGVERRCSIAGEDVKRDESDVLWRLDRPSHVRREETMETNARHDASKREEKEKQGKKPTRSWNQQPTQALARIPA